MARENLFTVGPGEVEIFTNCRRLRLAEPPPDHPAGLGRRQDLPRVPQTRIGRSGCHPTQRPPTGMTLSGWNGLLPPMSPVIRTPVGLRRAPYANSFRKSVVSPARPSKSELLEATGMVRTALTDLFEDGRPDRAAINKSATAQCRRKREPVRPQQLGIIGKDHIAKRLRTIAGVNPETFPYRCMLRDDDGIPAVTKLLSATALMACQRGASSLVPIGRSGSTTPSVSLAPMERASIRICKTSGSDKMN